MDAPSETNSGSVQDTKDSGWSFAFPTLHLVTPEEANAKAREQIEQGEKLMEEGKYKEAADLFSEASEATAVNHGEESLEMAEVLNLYGKSLMAIANETFFTGSGEEELQAAIARMIGGDGDEDDESEDDEVSGESEEEKEDGKEKEEKKEKEAKEEKEEKKEGEQPENKEGEEESSGEDEDSSSEGEGEGEEGDPAALAWQVFEVARVILSKPEQLDDKYKRILSDVHMNLGDLEVDAGNQDNALAEFEKCLHIREALGDLRFLAEGHYLVGLSLAGVDLDSGMPHLEKALDIFVTNNLDEEVVKDIKERMEEIKLAIEEAEKAANEDPVELFEEGTTTSTTTTTTTTNAFGAPQRDVTNVAVHDFGTVGGARKKRKAEGEAGERQAKKKREEKK